nr:hypothetical protein [Tanacetum cinerariifolium]
MFPRRSEEEDSEYPFFEGDGLSSDEWREYGMAGDDYERPSVFDDDQYEEESMAVYDTDIEDVIGEEEGFIGKGGFGGEEDCIEDVIVVANDFCSSMIQTTLNVDFGEDFNTKSHELMSFEKKYYYQGVCKPLASFVPIYAPLMFQICVNLKIWTKSTGFQKDSLNKRYSFESTVIEVCLIIVGIRASFLIKMFPRRSEKEDSEYPFFDGDGLSSDEWREYGMAGDDYEGPSVFDDDQYEEESMAVYDTDIEDVIEEEKGFIGKGGFGGEEDCIEDVIAVANDFCSSMIQTTLNVDFGEDFNTKSHELMSFEKKYYYQGQLQFVQISDSKEISRMVFESCTHDR